jgi:succinate dehydrogenase / fumarate reductase cytochrome b subunit
MTMETNQVASSSNRSFWFGKLFSLFGIVPLGLYVVMHLYSNLRSLYGEENFNHHLSETRSMPLIVPLTILVIWIPIIFHGLYGLLALKKSRPNLGRFPFLDNLKYVLQRLSGIGLLLFIPAHVYKTRLEPILSHTVLDFKHMGEGLSEPLTLIVYILGILGVAYHLANGVWQFAIGWGITTSEKGMKRVQVLSYVLFVALLVMGYGAIWGFLNP